jgi:hypothetical protein
MKVAPGVVATFVSLGDLLRLKEKAGRAQDLVAKGTRSMTPPDDARVCEKGWDGHQEEQLRRLAKLSLAEKLEWLEEADRVVRHLGRSTASSKGMTDETSS